MRSSRSTPGVTATEGDKLRTAVRECWARLPTIAFFGFFINLLFLSSPIYLTQLFDRVMGSGSVETLLALTVIVVVAALFMGALDALRAMLLNRAARWIEQRMAPELIGASMRLALEGLQPNAQALRDLATIKQFVGSSAIAAFGDIVWTPLFLVALWWVDPWIGLLGVGAALLLLLLMLASEIATKHSLTQGGRQAAANTQRAETLIRNAAVIHAMGMAPAILRHWGKLHREAADLMLRGADRGAWLAGTSKTIRFLVQILILAAGCYLVLRSDLTTGSMMACSIIAARALAPIEQMTSSWKSFVAAREAYGRIVAMLDPLPQERPSMLLPPPKGRLVCSDVTYAPRKRAEPALISATFTIEPGMALGIIGPSAAGKSTLCKILAGILRPTRGHARLDGVDLFDWSPTQLGPHVGYVPQEAELFDGEIHRLIARMADDPDPDAVVDAARTAGAHEMITALPDGYDTLIGEAGHALSGGQRQRLALARALYGRPKLLILDEPNANLDGAGEASLMNAMETARGWGATVIIVAHQFALLRSVDRVLVVKAGRIEMYGTRAEVMNSLGAGQDKAVAANGPAAPTAIRSDARPAKPTMLRPPANSTSAQEEPAATSTAALPNTARSAAARAAG